MTQQGRQAEDRQESIERLDAVVAVLRRPDLTRTERVAYGVLVHHATGNFLPALVSATPEWLAVEIGASERTGRRVLRRLQELRLIRQREGSIYEVEAPELFQPAEEPGPGQVVGTHDPQRRLPLGDDERTWMPALVSEDPPADPPADIDAGTGAGTGGQADMDAGTGAGTGGRNRSAGEGSPAGKPLAPAGAPAPSIDRYDRYDRAIEEEQPTDASDRPIDENEIDWREALDEALRIAVVVTATSKPELLGQDCEDIFRAVVLAQQRLPPAWLADAFDGVKRYAMRKNRAGYLRKSLGRALAELHGLRDDAAKEAGPVLLRRFERLVPLRDHQVEAFRARLAELRAGRERTAAEPTPAAKEPCTPPEDFNSWAEWGRKLKGPSWCPNGEERQRE